MNVSRDLKADRLVPARCARCRRRYGKGTLLGELLQLSDGRWAWTSAKRVGYGEDRRVAVDSDLRFGGVEVRCRRCGFTSRFRVSRLAATRDGRALNEVHL